MTPTQPGQTNQPNETTSVTSRRALVMWVAGALLVGGAVGAGVASLVDSDSTNPRAASTPIVTAATAATTTTVPTTTPPPPTAAPSPCATPQGCAQALYDAWKHNDQAAAAKVADPNAVTMMFSSAFVPIQTNSGPMDPYQTGPVCSGAAGSVICTWNGQDLELQMRVQNNTGGLPIRVVQVRLFEGAPLHEV